MPGPKPAEQQQPTSNTQPGSDGFLPLLPLGNGTLPRWAKVLVTYALHFGPGFLIALVLIFADLGIIASEKAKVYSQMQEHFKAQYTLPDTITKQTKLLRAICRNTARMAVLARRGDRTGDKSLLNEIESLSERLQAQCDEI
jgi:hypothetical protein